jgi:hypothetical protein
MVQKHIIVSMIAPVAMAGILIMAILANQAYASGKSESSSSEKCKTTENGNSQGEENCKTAQGENTEGGKVAQESSNTGKEVKESSNNGNAAQESSNNGKVAPVQPAITLTPIQAHVTTKAHMTATNEQLSNNGKATTPTPTGPTVAPRVEGAKTIAEVQQLKKAEAQKEFYKKLGEQFHKERMSKGIKFNPSNEACEGATASEPGKVVCLGKVVPRPINPGNLAMHPSTTVHHMGKGPHGAALTSNAGLGGLVKPAGHLAKMVQKVGNETLAMSKALLGIKEK